MSDPSQSQTPQSGDTTQSVLSAMQRFTAQDLFPAQPVHPFSASPEEYMDVLNSLVETTNQISQSLHSHLSVPLSNPKVLSMFRQSTTMAHTSDQNLRQIVSTLRNRVGITYGDDVPLDRSSLVDWCISRLEAWGTSAGMEIFKEEERDRRTTAVLGGKILVMDVDFVVDRTDPEMPSIDIANLRTTYAIPNGGLSANIAGSASLDGFMTNCLKSFLSEAQKPDEEQDTVEVARQGSLIAQHLKYLMRLDQLALREGDGGLHWFNFIDRLAVDIEQFATQEAEAVSAALSISPAPLDIFLMRAHALPLPYLMSPSISFLVHVSPLAYLTLLRTAPPITAAPTNSHLPLLDISLNYLRSRLGAHPLPSDVTIATLNIDFPASRSILSNPISMHDFTMRPTFPLVPSGEQFDRAFPRINEMSQQPSGDHTIVRWVLDFTDGGRHPGVVMSQSRMREIELVINPLGNIDHLGEIPMTSYGFGSWVDLLLNPNSIVPSERYTASYISPTSAHPPLRLRLAAPVDPGFILEKVPVQNIKEVWGVLEIVREQCWLNSVLQSCHWEPEGSSNDDETEAADAASVGEAELNAVLSGTSNPRKIPVNVYLPIQPPPDSIFDSDLDTLSFSQERQNQRTRIVMTSPERPPISGLVEISVAFAPSRPRGVMLNINGAMGVDLNIDTLEESCRRGGVLGIPGRIWAKAHGHS